MTESESEYDKLRRAARELGGPGEFVIEPVEESERFAAAARDEAPVADLAGVRPRLERAPRRSWRSPISAHDVAQAVDLRTAAVEPSGAVWWQERRPDGDGCRLIQHDQVTGETRMWEPPVDCDVDVVPVRGGVVVAGSHGGLYLLRDDQQPQPLTADPPDEPGTRHTDLVLGPDGSEVWCVRQSRRAGATTHAVVAVPLDSSLTQRTLLSGGAVVSTPVPSPDGTLLAWTEWDPPRMPWDGSRLRVGRVTPAGVAETRTLLGGDAESVFQPAWASPDSLYVVSDRTRWWNLYQVSLDGTVRPLRLSDEEFGWPQNRPGLATYRRLADGRLAVLHGCGDWRLDLLDPADGTLTPLDLPFTAWLPTLHTSGNTIVGVAGTLTRTAAVVAVDAATGRQLVLRQAADDPSAAYLPHAHTTSFVARDGHEVHAVVYPPRNPMFRPVTGARVPYLLVLPEHPGAQTTRIFNLATVWFTSRGIGVAVVDCRGSSGYGRGYREQIYGRWGVADVEDCAIAVHGLVEHWSADPTRIAVRGAGAGGTLALEALANTDLFAAATVYAPITDLPRLADQNPDAMAAYLREISADSTMLRPASWLDHIRRPVLMFHGERDTVTPVTQTLLLRDTLRTHGVPHTCVIVADEGHILQRSDTIVRAMEAELSFYNGAFAE